MRQPDSQEKPHGLARWLSKFGLMSRTQAERRVLEGRVRLNGRRVLDPELPCHPQRDAIMLDGRPLRRARQVYLALHKPAGYITTAVDPRGRPTVHDLLPPETGPVQAVGRLDADSTGLLLFTNDTAFAARVTDGECGVEKVYEVRLEGRLRPEEARRFEAGVELDGQLTRPARCAVLAEDDDTTLAEVTLTEGRNRQVRRMWKALGYRVLSLKRTRIGPILLGDLPPGRTRKVSEAERAILETRSAL